MQLIVYIYYWQLVFKNDNLKYTATSQRRSFNSISFFSSFLFLLSLFKISCTKKHHSFNLYSISYTLSFCYVMYYIVLEICISGRFLEDCFYCYSWQIMFVMANESLIPSNLIKEHQKQRTFNTVTTNTTPSQIKKI